MTSVLLAETTRADVSDGRHVVESQHVGHVVVATTDGDVVAAAGDPDHLTFVRSAAKPFQATACLELLGPAAAHLSEPEIALAWASHRGERIHLDVARRLLGRSGTGADALTCPSAEPEADPAASPSRLAHNCSGKHALFAFAGQHQGTPRERLLDPDGPLQRAVLGVVADALGPAVAVAVDGCGAPAVAVPLRELARGYAALVRDERWQPVRRAGLANPLLVGGTGRLESALLEVGVVAKIGAEGVFAAAWVDPRGVAHGLAVKADDGAARAATAAAAAVLRGSGVADPAWAPDPVLGGGREAGTVRVPADVERLLG